MKKVDLRKEWKHLYAPSKLKVSLVEVPPHNYLMVDGVGDPNTSDAYRRAVQGLFAVSYALKFMIKRGPQEIDYSVMPLEGLWGTQGDRAFDANDKASLSWTSMILQPEWVSEDLVEEALAQVKQKKKLDMKPDMRFAELTEGKAAQILHLGPYDNEPETIERLHSFIAEQGLRPAGRHHEIYLNDPSRTAPEKLKTIIRQPVE